MSESHEKVLARLSEKLSLLNIKRTNYMYSLLHGKDMVHGIPHEVYRTCGKTSCKCARGAKHGPYAAISVNKKGRQKIVLIKKADQNAVMHKAERYKLFQQNLTRIRKIDKEINQILVQLKLDTTSDYIP